MTHHEAAQVVSEMEALEEYVPISGPEDRGQACYITLMHKRTENQIDLRFDTDSNYIRIRVALDDLGHPPEQIAPILFETNLSPFLAGLRLDKDGVVWSEAALLANQAEANEIRDATESVLAVWMDGHPLFHGP